MEGILWKWTNYWNGGSILKRMLEAPKRLSDDNVIVVVERKSITNNPRKIDISREIIKGWQTRWFILENGVLSYYKSQEEVSQGCKGSIKVQACEINVSPIDHTRMDLVIPGEQHMYLRAATSQERQQWLVALGTAKACVHNRKGKENVKSPDLLKTKKSELKLYCDLLMQQVHVIKTSAQTPEGPQIENMDETTRLLGATCDTFIKTLDECMKLSASATNYEIPAINESILLPATTKKVLNRSNSHKT